LINIIFQSVKDKKSVKFTVSSNYKDTVNIKLKSITLSEKTDTEPSLGTPKNSIRFV